VFPIHNGYDAHTSEDSLRRSILGGSSNLVAADAELAFTDDEVSGDDQKAHRISIEQGLFADVPPVWRTLTRTLIKTYGWPVTSFLDLNELVKLFCDVVQAERSTGT